MLTTNKKLVPPPVLTELFHAWLDFFWIFRWPWGRIVDGGQFRSPLTPYVWNYQRCQDNPFWSRKSIKKGHACQHVSAALKIPEPFDPAVTCWSHYHKEITPNYPKSFKQMYVNYKTCAWIIAKKIRSGSCVQLLENV